MIKIKTVVKMIFVVIAVISIQGCGIEDKPLPFSEMNQRELSEKVKEAFSQLDRSSLDTKEKRADSFMRIDKKAIENMGYSYDKTVLAIMLSGEKVQGLDPMYIAMGMALSSLVMLHENSKLAYEKGYISELTYNLINVMNKHSDIKVGPHYVEFLKYVRECQSKGNGECNTDTLYKILIKNNKDLPCTEPLTGISKSLGGCRELQEKYATHKYRNITIPSQISNVIRLKNIYGFTFHIDEAKLELFNNESIKKKEIIKKSIESLSL